MYSIPRRIFLDGAVGPRIYPSEGIVAGSKTAATEAKMYVMPMLEDVSVTTEEQASASIHIDDIISSSWAFGLEDCVQYLWRFGLKLKEGLAALHLPLAVDKLAIAASSGPLLKRANEVLGMVAGAAVPSALHLGIDSAS
eukprot:6704138-Pyramimonas_sp.AAC.1